MENEIKITPLYAIVYAIKGSMENLRFDKEGYGLFYKRNRKHFSCVPIRYRKTKCNQNG